MNIHRINPSLPPTRPAAATVRYSHAPSRCQSRAQFD